MPKVSVIIPTYNRPEILRDRAVRSIREQTFEDWECIVVDSSADDATEKIILGLAKEDPRMRYIRTGANGQSAARNLGIKDSRGDYIAFNDDDDEFLPRYLEVAVKAFADAPDDVTFFSASTINRDYYGGESYSFPQTEPFWKYQIGGGWFFKRKVFFEDGLFFQEGWRGFEDIDLNIRFHLSGQKALTSPEPLRIYYTAIGSPAQSWSKNYAQQEKDFKKFFVKNGDIYRQAGKEAYAWICRFGGTIYLQNGSMKKGRELLGESFRARPTFYVFLFWCVSCFGHRAFLMFDSFKSKVMRFLRVHLLNVRQTYHPTV